MAAVLFAVTDGGEGERREEVSGGAVGVTADTEDDSEGEDRWDEAAAGALEGSAVALGDGVSG